MGRRGIRHRNGPVRSWLAFGQAASFPRTQEQVQQLTLLLKKSALFFRQGGQLSVELLQRLDQVSPARQ